MRAHNKTVRVFTTGARGAKPKQVRRRLSPANDLTDRANRRRAVPPTFTRPRRLAFGGRPRAVPLPVHFTMAVVTGPPATAWIGLCSVAILLLQTGESTVVCFIDVVLRRLFVLPPRRTSRRKGPRRFSVYMRTTVVVVRPRNSWRTRTLSMLGFRNACTTAGFCYFVFPSTIMSSACTSKVTNVFQYGPINDVNVGRT